MSLNYADSTLLAYVKTSTPYNDTILAKIPCKNHDILVTDMLFNVQTAGTNASGKLVLETDEASPTTLAELTVGTSAARTDLAVSVAESLRRLTAGVGAQVRWSGTEGVGVGFLQVFGTYPHM